MLRVDAKGLPALGIADSSKIRIGDLVLVIGDPFGIGQTVTMGIISAVGVRTWALPTTRTSSRPTPR